MKIYASVQDMIALWREMSAQEMDRAVALLPAVSSALRTEAKKRGKDLDAMVAQDEDMALNAKSVTVDIAARMLNTPTSDVPATQYSQSAMGYSVSGSYLVPGGGMFIKKSELARLGLNRQRFGGIDMMGG